jgi:hypothetical protein
VVKREDHADRNVHLGLIPADVPDQLEYQSIDGVQVMVQQLPVDDPYVNSLGAKGAGKLGITGLAPAVANAVYHAKGKRIRAAESRMRSRNGLNLAARRFEHGGRTLPDSWMAESRSLIKARPWFDFQVGAPPKGSLPANQSRQPPPPPPPLLQPPLHAWHERLSYGSRCGPERG